MDEPVGGVLGHAALFYRGRPEAASQIAAFVEAGLELGEPAFIALARRPGRCGRRRLDGAPGEVIFADMTELGRNPARIIPEVRAFIDDHPGQRVSYVGEPIWPSRSAAELRETARHEALINLAFSRRGQRSCAHTPSRSWQPGPGRRAAHAPGAGDGQRRRRRPGGTTCPRPVSCRLSPPPAGAVCLSYTTDLSRAAPPGDQQAALAGLPETASADLVLAVDEITANTMRHTEGGGTHVWHTADEVICQVARQRPHRRPAGRAVGACPRRPAVMACGWSIRSATWSRSGPARRAPRSGCTCAGQASCPCPPQALPSPAGLICCTWFQNVR